MKKLMILMLSCFGFVSIAMAQNDDMTSKEDSKDMADYERYFDKMLDMEYRNSTIKALDMSSEEIEEFSPILEKYMKDKRDLAEERRELLEDYKEEMSEDDSKKDKDDDRADFIEGYLSLNADEIKLKKKYFDEIEDEISVDKAIRFLLWEDMLEDRMNRRTIVQIIPVPTDMQYMSRDNDTDKKEKYKIKDREEKMVSKGYDSSKKMKKHAAKDYDKNAIKTSIKDFNNWMASDDAKVDLSHDYTYTGVQKIMNVLSSMNDNGAMKVSSFNMEKEEIIDMVAKLKENRMSDKHADIAKKTFTAIANLMNNDALKQAANKIDVDTLMTKQAPTIRNFFKVASNELQSMSMHDVKQKEKMNDKY